VSCDSDACSGSTVRFGRAARQLHHHQQTFARLALSMSGCGVADRVVDSFCRVGHRSRQRGRVAISNIRPVAL
jgi:hypothetical protein